MPSSKPTLVTGILFSDYAIKEAETGKISLIGCFHRLNFTHLPAKFPSFFVTVGIGNLEGSIGEMKVTACFSKLGSSDQIASTTAIIRFSENARPFTEEVVIEVPMPLNGIVVEEAGIYEAVVLIDGDEVGRRAIHLEASETTIPQN